MPQCIINGIVRHITGTSKTRQDYIPLSPYEQNEERRMNAANWRTLPEVDVQHLEYDSQVKGRRTQADRIHTWRFCIADGVVKQEYNGVLWNHPMTRDLSKRQIALVNDFMDRGCQNLAGLFNKATRTPVLVLLLIARFVLT